MDKSNDKTLILDGLNKLSSVEEIKDYIIGLYKSCNEDKYMPAIIQEGIFTVEKGSDFYLKLILKHIDIPINQTWMKGNLSFGIVEPKEGNEINYEAYVHNVIVWRNYESKNLYQVNPNITHDSIIEYKNSNTEYVNAKCDLAYGRDEDDYVLKKNASNHLMILKAVLQDYINKPDTNIYPKYELIAEFEYRTHKDKILNQSAEYRQEDSLIKVDKNESVTVILGSVKIPFSPYERTKVRDVQVIDLHTKEVRAHKPDNFTGDREAGFILFRKDVIDILRKVFYFYDLNIINKANIEERYHIDVLDDKVVFWESEYNKLAESVKNEIDLYNIKDGEKDNIISQAMYEWQLMASWSWAESLNPSQKLANVIASKYFLEAVKLQLTFIEPKEGYELSQFISRIEKITEIKLESFNPDSADVSALLKIAQGKEVSGANLKNLYEKYCYAVWRKLNDL